MMHTPPSVLRIKVLSKVLLRGVAPLRFSRCPAAPACQARHSRGAALLFPAAVAFLLAAGPLRGAWGQADEALVQEIKDTWATQAAAVQSARVRVRYVFRLARSGLAHSEVSTAFDRLMATEKRGDVAALHRELQEVVARIIDEDALKEWWIVEIVVDGKNVRNTAISNGQVWRDAAFHNGQHVEFFAKSGFGLVGSGPNKAVLLDVRDIRVVPSTKLAWSVTSANEPGQLTLEHGEGSEVMRVTVDKATKMPLRVSSSWLEQVRGGYQKFEGGVWSPTYGIDAQFGGGTVRNVDAFIVESATFNPRIDPSEFSVKLASGARMSDQRTPHRVATGVVKEGGVDAIRFADQISGK
jgi:hypothetical protein